MREQSSLRVVSALKRDEADLSIFLQRQDPRIQRICVFFLQKASNNRKIQRRTSVFSLESRELEGTQRNSEFGCPTTCLAGVKADLLSLKNISIHKILQFSVLLRESQFEFVNSLPKSRIIPRCHVQGARFCKRTANIQPRSHQAP